MKKFITSAVAAIMGNAQAQALTTFAALSALSMEWLHIPLGPLLWAALGGIMALLMSPAPTAPHTKGQSLINIAMTLCCVPASALLGTTAAAYMQWDMNSGGTYLACWAVGLTLHKALPAMIERFGQRLVDAVNKVFEKVGI